MVDTEERTVVITGGTGGIGLQSAVGIAKTGARVLVTGRSRERGEAALQHIAEAARSDRVELVVGDLSSIAGVDALAEALCAATERIDVLVNNAGYFGDERCDSVDGLEMHFAVNVLAPWRLTMGVLPALSKAPAARVVNVTGGDKPAAVDVDDLQAEKGFRGLMIYTHSKSALESLSMALAAEPEPQGICVNVGFLGRASTAMARGMSLQALPGWMKLFWPLFRLMFAEDGGKSAAKAARSTIWAATAPELAGVTARYFDTNTREQQLHPSAYGPDVQRRILAVVDAATSGARGTG